MVRAESYVREAGAKQIRVGVLVRNEASHKFYRAGGFRDYAVQLIKPLDGLENVSSLSAKSGVTSITAN